MNIRESAVHLPENVRLSDVQVAEIRKAFSMCDRDGDGFIDSNDLRTGIIKQILPFFFSLIAELILGSASSCASGRTF
jgi:Ca2+-binding EF-hand superfamily protein